MSVVSANFADTIFAQASGLGRAGVAVFRISGPQAGTLFDVLTGRPPPPARRMTRIRIFDLDSNIPIDDALAVNFPNPHSFTGEDVIEFHIHGGPAVIAALVDLLSRHIRIAEPGEFSRRAFENGKMDLTAAEGLADLVNAETEAQRRQAYRQLQGELGDIYNDWRNRLLDAIARVEAEIDFSDEDLPNGLNAAVGAIVRSLCAEISRHLDDDRRGEVLRDGFHIAIVGAPNVGKSSILNRISKRDAAIVASSPGTTRDIIEVRLNLDGNPVVLADTAGLRTSGDEVESEGVRRAMMRAQDADLKLFIFDAGLLPELDGVTRRLLDDKSVVAVNKSDLIDSMTIDDIEGHRPHFVSAKTGDGFDKLLGIISDYVADQFMTASDPALTRVRHRRALESCQAALDRFQNTTAVELAAEDLRLAARYLGQITGRVKVDDILDIIFREFCIGK